MRTYYSRSHRALARGSIEVEGRWAGVQWIALVLLAVLPIVWRSPIGLGMVAVAAVGVFVFPARRRVIFDVERRVVRIDHAGFFGERRGVAIPFDEVRRFVLQPAGRKGGRALFAAFVRTEAGRTYLVTHAGERDTAALEQEVRGLLRRARA